MFLAGNTLSRSCESFLPMVEEKKWLVKVCCHRRKLFTSWWICSAR